MSNLSELKLVTKADAAVVFGVCTKTIDNYIREGRLPPPVPFASREYWHPADFQAFLDRTFRRGVSVLPEQGFTAAACSAPPAGAAIADDNRPRAAGRGERDSNPVVRQRARQQAKLRALNAGA